MMTVWTDLLNRILGTEVSRKKGMFLEEYTQKTIPSLIPDLKLL